MALNKKLVKLCKMIGGLPGAVNKIDEEAPEYYSMVNWITDEMLDMGLLLGLRKPKTVEEMVQKSGKSFEETKRILDEMAWYGLVKVWFNEERNADTYMIQIFAPGTLEMLVGNTENVTKHPEIGKAFEQYTRERVRMLAANLPMGTSMMRVIPIESALEGVEGVTEFERISYYLNKYDKFSVSACSCRRSRRLIGEGCGHLEDDMCVQIGSGAEYYIRTGKAREITREEALAIFKKAEENGLMHQIPNLEGKGETVAICNCCSCSCFAMRIGTYYGAFDAIRSNFTAEVKTENCVACGQCVENCPTNALQLGQKLCTKTPLKDDNDYPTLRDHKCTEDFWNKEYRTNRKDEVSTGTAPCKAECPAHIAVQGYIKLAAQGKYTEALELIKKENPLPAVCGRICPHKCEDACTRGSIDNPIAIDEIKKFIADKDLDAATRFIPKKRHDYSMKKMAIIGSGPAGLSCAYYLALDGYSITVFEKEERLGGMLTLGIPSFRLEKDVLDAEIDVLREMGVEFKTGVEVGKDVTIQQLREEGYDGFYLAIGAQGGRKLGVEGEDATGVIAGVDFLRDVALKRNEELHGNVVVIGGGNVAIDVARTAVRTGAQDVNMYCLEARNEMPALDEEIEEAEAEEIKINNSWGPKRIIVEDGKVTGVEFKKCVSVFDADHKFSPKFDENDTIIVHADYVLLSIGQSIVWNNLLDGLNVELNRNNTVKADSFTYATGEEDIFVGGDCYTGPKFAINAIAAGKEGAISLHRSVWPGQSLVLGRDKRQYHGLDKQNLDLDSTSFDNTPRQRPLHIAKNEKTFKDTRATFTEEQLKKETARCLGCGAVIVDEYKCVGCGQCTTKCKFDAIHLKKTRDVYAPVYEKLPIAVAKNALKRTAKIVARPIKDVVTK